MTLSEELGKLHELHQRGALTDEEFLRAKSHAMDGPSIPDYGKPSAAMSAINGLRRTRSDRWIAGVCGGLARATGLQSWVWRLIFATLTLFAGTGLLLYVLMWIFVPSE